MTSDEIKLLALTAIWSQLTPYTWFEDGAIALTVVVVQRLWLSFLPSGK